MEKRKVIVIGAAVGIDIIKATEIASEKGIELIFVDDHKVDIKSIPDLMLEKLAKEKADLQSLITSAQYAREVELAESIFEYKKPKIGDIVYLPDLRKTRKEKKQEYNFNHRKNWRKRK